MKVSHKTQIVHWAWKRSIETTEHALDSNKSTRGEKARHHLLRRPATHETDTHEHTSNDKAWRKADSILNCREWGSEKWGALSELTQLAGAEPEGELGPG